MIEKRIAPGCEDGIANPRSACCIVEESTSPARSADEVHMVIMGYLPHGIYPRVLRENHAAGLLSIDRMRPTQTTRDDKEGDQQNKASTANEEPSGIISNEGELRKHRKLSISTTRTNGALLAIRKFGLGKSALRSTEKQLRKHRKLFIGTTRTYGTLAIRKFGLGKSAPSHTVGSRYVKKKSNTERVTAVYEKQQSGASPSDPANSRSPNHRKSGGVKYTDAALAMVHRCERMNCRHTICTKAGSVEGGVAREEPRCKWHPHEHASKEDPMSSLQVDEAAKWLPTRSRATGDTRGTRHSSAYPMKRFNRVVASDKSTTQPLSETGCIRIGDCRKSHPVRQIQKETHAPIASHMTIRDKIALNDPESLLSASPSFCIQ